ncbi:PASTA domain-containing protein [Gemmatimonadota bacterium]
MTTLRSNSNGGTDFGIILKTAGLLIVLLLIITAFFLGGMVLVDQVIMPAWTDLGSEVELPDVVDLDFYAAKSDLGEIGLELERIEESFHAVIDEGRIIEQVPPPYTRVKKGRTVGVVVSRGPEEVIIPDLTRLTTDQARARLQEFGLTLGSITSRPDNAPEGTVIDQRPTATLKALRNTRIDLVISSGPVHTTIPIPRLVNMGLNGALARIRDLDGKVWIVWVEDDSQVMMTVVGQLPEPGMEIEGQLVFDLTVAVRTGFRPTAAMVDTVGIGAPPPWMRGGDVPPPDGGREERIPPESE